MHTISSKELAFPHRINHHTAATSSSSSPFVDTPSASSPSTYVAWTTSPHHRKSATRHTPRGPTTRTQSLPQNSPPETFSSPPPTSPFDTRPPTFSNPTNRSAVPCDSSD